MVIVIMKAQARMREISAVIARIEDLGYEVHLSEGDGRTIIGLIGEGRPVDTDQIEGMAGVERCVPVLQPFKLTSRDFKPDGTTFPIGNNVVGGDEIILIDEVLTPDSSRFWPADKYEAGRDQESYDKQYVRNYLESINFNKKPPGPTLPDEVVQGTRKRYVEAYEQLSGAKF